MVSHHILVPVMIHNYFDWIHYPAHPASLKRCGWHPTWQDSIESTGFLSAPHVITSRPWCFAHGCWRKWCKMSFQHPEMRKCLIDLEMILQNLMATPINLYTCAQEILCLLVYLWQPRAWPHLLLVLWQQQAVIIFIFCCCSLHPSLYTVDQYVIPLLLPRFGTDNVLEDKPAQA